MLPVDECRQEVSRLLGLIGAPPLHWNVPDCETQSCDLDSEKLALIREAAILVVEFVEAHVQFLLAIDDAYQWLQISSSLHLGLGPRSQCVERVERASVAREFRKSRRRHDQGSPSSTNSTTTQGTRVEPQKGLGKSILSLSHVRHHLAQTMVDQSDSILHLFYSMQETIASSPDDDIYPSDPLEYPDVIDLIWIKGARQQLANILSNSLNVYSTVEGLSLIGSNLELRTLMEASMENARNAREYILANLLLEKSPSTTNAIPNTKDPLLVSLMKFREQVDALSGAIWSCQQFTESEHAFQEEERMEWWNHVRQLSETCRSMEADIGQRFFAIPIDEDSKKEQDGDGMPNTEDKLGSTATAEEYELNDNDDAKDHMEKNLDEQQQRPTKTVVFKGQGMKEDRPPSPRSRPDVGGNREMKHSLPPRDTMSERQMIQELQNRITTMRQAEDDDDDDDDDLVAEKSKNQMRPSRLPAVPLFLGASGSLLSELRQTLPLPSSVGEEHVLEE